MKKRTALGTLGILTQLAGVACSGADSPIGTAGEPTASANSASEDSSKKGPTGGSAKSTPGTVLQVRDGKLVEVPMESAGTRLPGRPGSKFEKQGGGFSYSCWNLSSTYFMGPYNDPGELTMWCGDGNGGSVHNTLHLDWVVTNSNGQLTNTANGYGDYQDSCTNCQVGMFSDSGTLVLPFVIGPVSQCGGSPCGKDVMLICEEFYNNQGCRNASGGWQTSAADLDDCWANYSGHLTWVCESPRNFGG